MKLIGKLTKRKRENTKINKIRNENRDIITGTKKIQKIIRTCLKIIVQSIGKSKRGGDFPSK